MTIDVANTHIILDAHEPKKTAVIGTLAPTVAATEVAIWAGSAVDVALVQSIIGGFTVLHRFAQTNIKSITKNVSMPLGGSEASIAIDAAPAAGDLFLEVGSDILAKEQSHFLDRTFKRLIEVWLEGQV